MTDPVVRALCGKSVALLGESPVHGFGRTLDFKVELVRRLVDECHYNALFVESGIYDYLHIQETLRSGQEVTDQMISTAIGGLWAAKEMQPLIPFLRERVQAGRMTLGGLDDQIGARTYASQEMAKDLVQPLAEEERAHCLATLQRHLLWQYTVDAPYGPQDKARFIACLNQMEARLAQPGESRGVMIDSLKRLMARDFREDLPQGADPRVAAINDRDRSMYLNFHCLLSRLPSHRKVIVWAATTHVARDLSVISGLENRISLGSYIQRDFKDRAFALGFSAYSGSYAMVRQPVQKLGEALPASLETQALADGASDTVYLSQNQLRKFGPVPARALGTTFQTTRWDKVLDGLVIFREEHPPEYLPR